MDLLFSFIRNDLTQLKGYMQALREVNESEQQRKALNVAFNRVESIILLCAQLESRIIVQQSTQEDVKKEEIAI